ncbi:hypothetical protein [Aureimonas psammosilenae]|uniref:hypothetical protein n=1 Tax=Aureimonas psammosilenae TaxID=2495496 RepID=UPI0012612162|nr:hypothetical protein [Aureimonas psammosilenae]
MKLPEIRAALLVLAGDIEGRGLEAQAGKLRVLAEETKRRPPVRRAPARARAVTPDLEDRIRETAGAHPSWSLHEIGAACGVNQGRVSEVLAGFRR